MTMADDFSSRLDFGLQLSKRIYYGKDSVSAPVLESDMSRSPEENLPTAPMVYAEIPEPEIVDNPDIPSYQPYVHGRCEPPALIPLHMHGVAMEIECCLDTAFVTVTGTWRVHCVMTSRNSDCLIAIPMGEQGSLLGVEADIPGRYYHTELISPGDEKDTQKVIKDIDGSFLKSQIYTLKIPQVEGGSSISVKMNWSQKLSYHGGQFCLNVPFSFPAYVTPVGRKSHMKEKIVLKLNSVNTAEVACKSSSHPLKELGCQSGKLSFSYEAEVRAWSTIDFNFLYAASSSDLCGGVLVQSPFLHDCDQREMFCLYLFPGNDQNRKVFRRDVVFIVDISGSMCGGPLESAKNALLTSFSHLNSQDKFNIIAFNLEVHLFSLSMVLATKESISKATEWMDMNFVAKDGTNILLPLTQAFKLLEKTIDSVPLIFLVTDGSVEDEREIYNILKSHLTHQESVCPRLYTFGIGLYCNHYFLQMLAQIGRGYYDAAYNTDSVDFRMQRLFLTASSIMLVNITVDVQDALDLLELFPTHIPDLSSRSPLIISGRYDGSVPHVVKLYGNLADSNNFVIELNVQRAKDIRLDKVLARRHIDTVTAQAWFTGNKELEQKVAKMSIQTGFPSEYTYRVLVQTLKENNAPEPYLIQEIYNKFNMKKERDLSRQRLIYNLRELCVGFGNLTATAENIPPGVKKSKSDAAELLAKAASNCCVQMANRCCCMCFIKACSFVNDQCTIACTQLCTGLAICQCFSCCFELWECI